MLSVIVSETGNVGTTYPLFPIPQELQTIIFGFESSHVVPGRKMVERYLPISKAPFEAVISGERMPRTLRRTWNASLSLHQRQLRHTADHSLRT